jgi:dihydropyrimidinase
MRHRKGVIAAGMDADVVVWDADLETTATQANRHGNVDYTPFEGMSFTGGPASVYIRGKLAFKDGEVVAPAGSGQFVERRYETPAPGPAVR